MKRPRRRYRYVTYRSPGNASRKAPGWYAQGPQSLGGPWGPFEHEEDAAAFIAERMKVDVETLLIGPKSKVVGRPRGLKGPQRTKKVRKGVLIGPQHTKKVRKG